MWKKYYFEYGEKTMKWIGAILLVSTTSWIGFDMSKKLTERPKQIRLLIQSLQMLETEMGYSQLTLQQTFQNISKKIPYPLNQFYERLAHKLSGIVIDFLTIWDEELSKFVQISALKQTEHEVMKQFGRNLGQHTFLQQQKYIKLTIHHLQRELDDAMEERRKYEKMMKSLGVLIGLLIVLLLF